MRTHPELEGLEWHAPLIPESQSQRAWKKEQRIARAFTPAYPPPRPGKQTPYIPTRKSMTVRFYVHAREEQTVDMALIDSGATENFMKLSYAQKLKLPIKEMSEPQMVFNVDGTPNKGGDIKHYTDLSIQTGQDFTLFRFFLTNTGSSKVILGYPWMCAVQPRIDWKRGWIDSEHLPIVFRIPGLRRTAFLQPNEDPHMQLADDSELSGLPQSY